MNPIIPWTVSSPNTPANLTHRFQEVLLRHPLIPKSITLLDHVALIRVFKAIAPKGFTFGFYFGVWGFFREKKVSVTSKLNAQQKVSHAMS